MASLIKSSGGIDAGLEILSKLSADERSAEAYSSAIGLCTRAREYDRALVVFNSIPAGTVDANCCNALVNAHGAAGQWEAALDVLRGMENAHGIKPNVITFSAAM